MVKKKRIKKISIGWREYVDLPEWGIKGLRAKIDTGARTSSLHVEDLKELPNNYVEFYVVLNKNNARKRVKAKKIKTGPVKSSTGIKTHRVYVQTKLYLANVKQKVLINLVAREGMNFRILVGRSALQGKFIVDVNRSFLGLPYKMRIRKKLKR